MLWIDEAAFDPEWQLGRQGLIEAHQAASSSVLLTDGTPHRVRPTGFAIVGTSGSIGYLQRLAVAPARQGSGLGRDLLMGALRWARGRGARTMLVNTQPENRRSLGLYESEGFEVLADRLSVLRAETRTPKPNQLPSEPIRP